MYRIMVCYSDYGVRGREEVIDEFTTKYEAVKMLKHYRVQYGSDYKLWIK